MARVSRQQKINNNMECIKMKSMSLLLYLILNFSSSMESLNRQRDIKVGVKF